MNTPDGLHFVKQGVERPSSSESTTEGRPLVSKPPVAVGTWQCAKTKLSLDLSVTVSVFQSHKLRITPQLNRTSTNWTRPTIAYKSLNKRYTLED